MATVFAPPEEIGDPPSWEEFTGEGARYDFDAHRQAEEQWLNALRGEAMRRQRERNLDRGMVGELLQFPRGDGYAIYVVWREEPLELIHCPIGDDWSLETFAERGLTLKDVQEHVDRAKALDELFGRSK